MICKKYFDIEIAISVVIKFWTESTKENICKGSSVHCTSLSTKSRHRRKLVYTQRCKHRLPRSEYSLGGQIYLALKASVDSLVLTSVDKSIWRWKLRWTNFLRLGQFSASQAADQLANTHRHHLPHFGRVNLNIKLSNTEREEKQTTFSYQQGIGCNCNVFNVM